MFGFGKRAHHWGLTELKNDLLQSKLSSTPDDVDEATRIILKGVFVHNFTKFKDRQDLFDSPNRSLTEIEAYLRSKIGSDYDKQVEKELDKLKSDYKEYQRTSKY